MFALLIVALAFLSGFSVTASGHQIRGGVVDATGASVGGASVQLLGSDSKLVAHVVADNVGKFSIETTDAGSLVLKVWRQGFRSRRLPVGTETEITDVGNVRLEIASCDAPGVICDWFGVPPPRDPIVSRGYVRMHVNCLAAFAVSKVYCRGGKDWKIGQAKSDLLMAKDERGVYLKAVNGAALSAPNLLTGDCRGVRPSETNLRVDGLGPGDDICLYTHDRRRAHVFFTDNMTLSSEQIEVWQITRKR